MMSAVDTLPRMSDLMDRQKIIGWIVRDGIQNQGITYTEASRRWPIPLPTLNRLMNTGNVSLRFYRQAEKQLELPHKLFDWIADGEVDKIRAADLEPQLKDYVLTELGEPPAVKPSSRPPRRKAQ